MKTVVHFDRVAKQYQLGLTRTSLPNVISEWVRGIFTRAPEANSSTPHLWALRDVSFELKGGESLALIGANGAGKTTVLKLLANITRPTSGQVTTNGSLSALIELGAGFHPDLSGRENVYLNGTILGMRRRDIDRRFDEIVSFSELEHFIDTPVKRYSSGMIVRLGFAVASCLEPEILLVDEVLAVGDASFQQKCLNRIRTLIKKGTSIIFVSHNLYLVQAVCSRALYLERGEVRSYGLTKDIIDVYEQDLHRERASRFEASQPTIQGEADKVEITRVDVLRADASKAVTFSSKEPAQIQIHYAAYKSLGKVQASAFVIRSDGLTCCMVRTKLDEVDLVLEFGQGIITLYLEPLQLVTGTYFVEAWLLDQSDCMGLTSKAGRSEWFSVKGAALTYDENSGIFAPNSRWNHSRDGAITDKTHTCMVADRIPFTN
ncbi:MAG: ABC transporter ATP-binding protein [Acidobacteriota bacterium]